MHSTSRGVARWDKEKSKLCGHSSDVDTTTTTIHTDKLVIKVKRFVRIVCVMKGDTTQSLLAPWLWRAVGSGGGGIISQPLLLLTHRSPWALFSGQTVPTDQKWDRDRERSNESIPLDTKRKLEKPTKQPCCCWFWSILPIQRNSIHTHTQGLEWERYTLQYRMGRLDANWILVYITYLCERDKYSLKMTHPAEAIWRT